VSYHSDRTATATTFVRKVNTASKASRVDFGGRNLNSAYLLES
jgi:hypothetical protein